MLVVTNSKECVTAKLSIGFTANCTNSLKLIEYFALILVHVHVTRTYDSLQESVYWYNKLLKKAFLCSPFKKRKSYVCT